MSSRFRLFQVDAFTRRRFSGNPAAVVPLERWLDDVVMRDIARENNLSETAFFVPQGDDYAIRWFTPEVEVELCGHATLSSGWVVLHRLAPHRSSVTFHSQSGPLRVEKADDALALWLPSRPPRQVESPGLEAALGRAPVEVWAARKLMAVFESEEEVRAIRPDMQALAALWRGGVIITAPGREVDFVSRYFTPGEGVPEDPVTGSAHCTLVPYWSRRLGKQSLLARQVSARGGELACVDEGERVRLTGHVVPYLEGVIEVDV